MHDLTITLYNVPFDKSYSNLFNFANKSELYTYFNNEFFITSVANMNYQRKDGFCMIEKTMQELQKVNYISYFVDGMRYFAFVDNKSFVNPKTTRLELTTDLFHTFFEHFEYPVCFIERRIPNSDYERGNLEPEDNLKIEPTYFHGFRQYGNLSMGSKFLFQTSAYSKGSLNENPNDGDIKLFFNCGNTHFTQNYLKMAVDESTIISFLSRFFDKTEENGVLNFNFPNFKKGYRVPTDFFTNVSYEDNSTSGLLNSTPKVESVDTFEIPQTIKNNSLYDYEPKNKKLLSHLFRKMFVRVGADQNLNEIEYSYRDGEDLEITRMKLFGDCEPLIAIEFSNTPSRYLFSYDNFYQIESSSIGDPDQLQNLISGRNNQIISGAMNVLLSLGSVATSATTGGASLLALGGSVSGAVSNIQSVANTNREIANARKNATTPTVSPNADYLYNTNCFNVMFGVPNLEILMKLDDYFTHYGYTQNIFSSPTPRYSTRPSFYYVKTLGAKIECSYLSSGELATLENAFNSGIHFWKNNIYNYDNNEVV